MTKGQVLQLLNRLRTAFPHPAVAAETLETYAAKLLPFDQAAAAQAIDRLIDSEDFWPSIHKIKHAYGMIVLNPPVPSVAWGQAQNDYDKAKRHPLVQEARRRTGDHSDWARQEYGFRRLFDGIYDEVLKEALTTVMRTGAVELPPAGRPALASGPTMAALPESDKIQARPLVRFWMKMRTPGAEFKPDPDVIEDAHAYLAEAHPGGVEDDDDPLRKFAENVTAAVT